MLSAFMFPLFTAWVPFLQPMDLHAHWLWLLLPLVFGIALVYKTLKLPDVSMILAETTRLSIYIFVLMFAAGTILWAVVETVERL